MTPIQRFEDLVAWQKARVLNAMIYRLTRDGLASRDFPFRDQLRGAAISVMNNIAEGFGRRGDKEFFYFLKIAKGSTTELQNMFYIGLDAEYFDEGTLKELQHAAAETAVMIHGLMEYLKRKQQP
jgi:four helix bundle protein